MAISDKNHKNFEIIQYFASLCDKAAADGCSA